MQTQSSTADSVLANPRITLGCYDRCFCNHVLPKISVKPNLHSATERQCESHYTYEVQISVVDDGDPTWIADKRPAGASSTSASKYVRSDPPFSLSSVISVVLLVVQYLPWARSCIVPKYHVTTHSDHEKNTNYFERSQSAYSTANRGLRGINGA